MYVAFHVIYRNQRKLFREAERLRISKPHKQRSDEPGTGRDCNRAQVFEPCFPQIERLPYNRNDCAQMLTRSELGNYASVLGVRVELRCNDARTNMASVLYDCCGSFIAGALDS